MSMGPYPYSGPAYPVPLDATMEYWKDRERIGASVNPYKCKWRQTPSGVLRTDQQPVPTSQQNEQFCPTRKAAAMSCGRPSARYKPITYNRVVKPIGPGEPSFYAPCLVDFADKYNKNMALSGVGENCGLASCNLIKDDRMFKTLYQETMELKGISTGPSDEDCTFVGQNGYMYKDPCECDYNL
jgi:hypothetical protein